MIYSKLHSGYNTVLKTVVVRRNYWAENKYLTNTYTNDYKHLGYHKTDRCRPEYIQVVLTSVN